MDILIKQLKNKDKVAFKAFFKSHYAAFVVYAQHYVMDAAVSEDLVQDVFIYLWENSTKLDIKTSVKAYAIRMIRNRCLNHLKALKITEGLDILELNAKLSIENMWEDTPTANSKTPNSDIFKIIEQLPQKMKEVVQMKYIQNYKYAEIAEELGISINTVKTQLKRAKLKIRELITLLFSLLFLFF